MSGILAASFPDAAVFAVCAVVVVAGAFGVVFSRNPVHAALSLVATLFGVAVLFVAQEAHFLAAVQVIVYAGAIVVLFLFVIMLLGVDREDDPTVETLRGQRPVAIGLGLLLVLLVLVIGGQANWATGGQAARGPDHVEGVENVELLGRSLFTDFLLPFEVTGVLLVIAVVGAVVLARRPPRSELAELKEEEATFIAASDAEAGIGAASDADPEEVSA